MTKEFQNLKDKGRIEFITFHPSYSYEEFVEGITVDTENNHKSDEIKYIKKDGIFKELCKNALGLILDQDITSTDFKRKKTWGDLFKDFKKYREKYDQLEQIDKEKKLKKIINDKRIVLIIDEINRGDPSKIFGELITLFEADKRLLSKEEITVRLPYTGDEFGVPPNLYIIGTMNTADRSIALVDTALRRRFGFFELMPNFEKLRGARSSAIESISLFDESIKALEEINERICEQPKIGRDKQVGHSFLWEVENEDDLFRVWRYEILPLLEEYCYGNYKLLSEILFKSEEEYVEYFSPKEGIKLKPNQLVKFLDKILVKPKDESEVIDTKTEKKEE